MYAQKKTIDNSHIVRERDRQRFRELLAVLSLGVPIGLFLLLFTWQNLEVIRLGHEATRLQQKRKQIEDANKALQLELDRLTAFAEVERKARALGFAPTEPDAIVMVTSVVPSVKNAPNGVDRARREPVGDTRASADPPLTHGPASRAGRP